MNCALSFAFRLSTFVLVLLASVGLGVVEKLHREIAAVLQTDAVRERYGMLGIEPVGNTPEQFADQIRADLARWEKVVKAAGIKLE